MFGGAVGDGWMGSGGPLAAGHGMNTSRNRVVVRWVAGLAGLVALGLLLGACDTSLQTPATEGGEQGTDVSGSVPTDGDVGGGSGEPSGVSGAVNACGGEGPLRWEGQSAEVLAPCGLFGEGVLVCGGLDVLRCVGESTDVNACGRQGVLPVEPGTPCGVCGDEDGGGTWVCDAGASAGVRCVGARAPNGCGGCALLEARPGAPCDEGVSGGEGRWTCASAEEMRCDAGDVNACGSDGELLHEGRPARPGDACALACGDGVLTCGIGGGLACVSTGQDPEANACGGCGLLPGVEGGGCGTCGDGVWTCQDGGLRCVGATLPNACGGCDGRTGSPGAACEDGRVWRCDGPLLECTAPLTPGERNACGGTVPLDGVPGESCGACDLGRFFCAGANRVECSRGDALPEGWCGCDGPYTEDAPCGSCGSGRLACVDEEVRCLGDAGPDVRNACGGCGDLPGDPGGQCGTCLAWACGAGGVMRCDAAPELEGCDDLSTCADLDPPCEDLRRACIDSDGAADARCGDCLDGFVEVGGACIEDEPSALGCSELEPACADSGRTCVEGVDGEDASCGACLDGHVSEGSACRLLLTCSMAECAQENRTCDERGPTEDAVCGGCLPSFELVAGACTSPLDAPTGVRASDGTSATHVRVTWNPMPGLDGVAYHVYRGGDRVTTNPVSGTAWNDTGAPAPPVPEQVTDVSASINLPDRVRVVWSPATPRPGASASYRVRAVVGDQQSGLSSADTGFRAAHPVSQYDVRMGSLITAVMTGTSWDHMDAPQGSITLSEPSATMSREDGVQLSIPAPTPFNGAPRTYTVRAINAAGPGPESVPVTGYRAAGTPAYQWQRSSTSTGPWSDLPGATSRTHLDTTIAAGATRWYRVQVTSPGTPGATSAAVEGLRRAPVPADPTLGLSCMRDGDCGATTWCPTSTPHRRCSPRPEILGERFPFVYVPAGTFDVGSPLTEGGRYGGGETLQEVTLTRSFFVQQTPVTQAQWAALGGNDVAAHSTCGPDCPVENITWWSAVWFANALSEAEGLTPCYNLTQPACSERLVESLDADGAAGILDCGQNTNAVTPQPQTVVYDCTGYRLLTAVEFERAVRAGTTGATWNGELNAQTATCSWSHTALESIAWYCWNAEDRTHPVREKNANPWALHDMLGNTWEWVFDRPTQRDDLGTDPLYATTGQNRMVRGGSFRSMPRDVRAANHDFRLPNFGNDDVGFRLARTVPAP
ncbi:MAG: hypothetical protein EA398_00935 [Deltaproteobacteria bacterium]|nr:MAG: hypothetical protein EA398_00935 [Deltaproteobacteria bacterium]